MIRTLCATYWLSRSIRRTSSLYPNQLRILYVLIWPVFHPSMCPLLICSLSRLLVTHAHEQEYIFLYEADISTELLDGLWNPKDATSPMKWPTIRREKIPYEPYNTFSSRLVAELIAPRHSPSHSPITSSSSPSSVIRHGRKRLYREERRGKSKIRRLSK